MKTKIAAFALLLLAGAAPAALAQGQDPAHDQGGRQDRGERPVRPRSEAHERAPQASGRAAVPPPRPSQVAPPAPAPAVAPQAREARPPRVELHSDQHAGGPRRPDNRDGRAFVRRPGSWVDTEGDDTSQGLSPPDRADQEDRQELRDWRRFNGGRGPQVVDPRRLEPRRPGERVPERDRRAHDDRRSGGDRGDRGDHDHRRPEWRPGVYPHSIESHRRFHARPYRRPPHFHVRVWSFGEVLPPAWFGPEYLIADWWNYDLPAPPYGYDWVRVGDDAVLVDDYSGRIVQVVRGLFW